MIKVYCDKCGNEIVSKHGHRCTKDGKDLIYMCDDCHTLLMSVKDKINIYRTSDVEKFCKMSAEDIELLRYTFKVGDKVITSTGKVGTIINICTCDSCKRRGFYEPRVDVEIGSGSIWITDNDKRLNFKSFYKIGDQVFGNIDEQSILHDIKYQEEEINNRRQELYELSQQLYVVNNLKKKK